MMYRRIECPTCGNETTAKSIPENQKCKWCRRLFKVKVVGRGKKSKWTAEFVEFPQEQRIRTIDDYMYEDIYGVPRR